MNKDLQDFLIKTVRNEISKKLDVKVNDLKRPENSKILDEKRGVFVTLELNGELCGCIGNIMPIYPLLEAVKKNAVSAAFHDPRFPPITKEDLDNLGIEISILSVPRKLKHTDGMDLCKKLRPMVDGVVLKRGGMESTYLPQVWEKIPDKEMFLCTLCQKAGLPFDSWRDGGMDVFTYKTDTFKGE